MAPHAEEGPALRAGFVMELRSRGARDARVLAAMERVPRRLFVPDELAEFAYADRALPFACGQTTERPSLVARMLEALQVMAGQRVLEIGSGTGWTTAVIARLDAEVTGVERYRSLVEAANARLGALGTARAQVEHADGLAGPPRAGRYHRIVAFGAVESLPQAWLDALARDGALLAPVGPEDGPQRLVRAVRTPDGIELTDVGTTRFAALSPGLSRAL
jgi:protein-L-isoaspartate(D-aspartate) O-methyltransferase